MVSLDYDVDEDGFPDESLGSGSSSKPEPQKATATCSKCSYVWTLRGVASLSYLMKENRSNCNVYLSLMASLSLMPRREPNGITTGKSPVRYST